MLNDQEMISYIPAPLKDVFQDLPEAALQEIERTITMTRCQKGRIFYRPEDKGEVLFFLKEGQVRLYGLSSEGQKQVVATIVQEDLFGEMALLGQGMRQTFAEAAADCILYVLSRQDVERLIVNYPSVALRMMYAMAERIDRLEIGVEDTVLASGRTRLAAYLLRLCEEQGGDEIHGYTPQDLAEAIGIPREIAGPILNELKSAQLIKIGREQLIIVDAPGLAVIAAEEK